MSEKTEVVGFYYVDHEQLLEDVLEAYETGIPLFVWGRTGIGKSYTIRKVAKILAEKYNRTFSDRTKDADDEHFLYVDKRLTLMDPTDLVGILYKDNGVSRWHYPEWLYKLSKDYEDKTGYEIRAILHLDELNLAAPLVQNAAYQLVLDRRVDELELADGVVVIAAGNVAEDKAYTFDLADPLRTRFTHVTLKVPTIEQWLDWATENNVDPRIIMFLKLFPDKLFDYNDTDRTFPTPRGWEFASKLMKGKDNEKAWKCVAKACGYLAGVQFRDFLELSKQISIDDILENPRKLDELQIDAKLSLISSIAMLFLSNPSKYVTSVLRVAAHLCGTSEELAALLLKSVTTPETKKILLEVNRKRKELTKPLTSLLKLILA